MSNCILLKTARREMKLTQAAFAEKIGLNACTVNKLERDETAWATIQAATLDKIIYGLEDKGEHLKSKFTQYQTEQKESKPKDEPLVIGPDEAMQVLGYFKTKEQKQEKNDNSKLLEMLDFIMEGLHESECDEEFKANLKIMKKILNKY